MYFQEAVNQAEKVRGLSAITAQVGGAFVCSLGSCRVINSATLEHCKTITSAVFPKAGTQPLI